MSFRRTTCPHCRGKLSPGQRIHEECVDGWQEARKAKQERAEAKRVAEQRKRERQEFKARKEASKPRSKWLAECQAVVNKYVRLRDRDLGCCSCDRPANWDGQWHASHLRSVGAASSIRFHLWNIHKGCSICNNHLSGNLAEYLPRIRQRIGDDKVDWLFQQNNVVKHDIDYLIRLKRIIGKRLKRMEKRYG